MITTVEMRELLDDVFEEEALVFGGLTETFPVEDELVDRLFHSLRVIRNKAIERLEDPIEGGQTRSRPRPLGEPHPAIEAFLASMGRS